MKYKTKPIDYTGCNEIIAEHLQRGEAVWCKVWDISPCKYDTRFIRHYATGFYIEDDAVDPEDSYWMSAEPIPTVQRVMPAERAIPVLIAEGWKFNMDGDMVRPRTGLPLFKAKNFCKMGNLLNEEDPPIYPACIIEDVDE